MTDKRCVRCYLIGEHGPNAARKSGLQVYCRGCLNEIALARYHRLRREWIEAHGPCADCGGADDLELDHRDARGKQYNPSARWREFATGSDELDKCVVRCRRCHVEKSLREGDYGRHTVAASGG